MCLPFFRMLCCKNSTYADNTNSKEPLQNAQSPDAYQKRVSPVKATKRLPVNDDHRLHNDFKSKVRNIQYRYLHTNDQRIIRNTLISLHHSSLEAPGILPGKREYSAWQAFYNRAAMAVTPKAINDQYSVVLARLLSERRYFDYFCVQRDSSNKMMEFSQIFDSLRHENTFIHCYPKSLPGHRPYRVYICTKTGFAGIFLKKMLTNNSSKENNHSFSPDFKLKIIAQKQAHLREETFVSYHPSLKSALSWAEHASQDELAYCLQGQAPSSSFRPFKTNSIGIDDSCPGKTALKVEATCAFSLAQLNNPYI